MTSTEFTTNYQLAKPDFNLFGWHDDVNGNFDLLDAIMFTLTGLGNFVGVWTNATNYTAGQRVIDGDDASIWNCNVTHTSSATDSMADDRAAHPTYWSLITSIPYQRGIWDNDIAYAIGDVAWSPTDGLYGVANVSHTSGASPITMRDEIANWSILIDKEDVSQSFNYGVYNVLDYGADPTGVADSGPAFRAVVGSNRTIIVPPGTYTIKTMRNVADFVPGQLNYFGNPIGGIAGWLFAYLTNFNVFGYGATIEIDPSFASGSTTVFVWGCTKFTFQGLIINQCPVTTGFNSGFGLNSVVNFRISDITFGPDLDYQAFFGGFMVDGVIDNIHMAHGQGGDFTLIKNIHFDHWTADGGNDTPAGAFMGIAQDPYTLSSMNETGLTIPMSENVTFTRMDVTGYGVGVWLREGRGYRFSENYWHDMPSGSTGIHLSYQEPIEPNADGAIYTSDGRPIHDVSIIGDTFRNITPTSIGVYVNPLGIALNVGSPDVLANITIDDCVFDNVDDAAIFLGTANDIENLVYGRGNTFRDCNNTVGVPFTTIAGVFTSAVKPTASFNVQEGFVTSLTDDGQYPSIITPSATLTTLDCSAQAGITIANGANAVFCPGGQGMLTFVINTTSLDWAFVVAGGGFIGTINIGTTWEVNTTTPAGTHQSLAFNAGAYKIYNNTGASKTYKLMVFRTA